MDIQLINFKEKKIVKTTVRGRLAFSMFILLLSVISYHSSVKPVSAASSDLRINEIMYSPPQGDLGAEWIELYNSGNEEVKIFGGAEKDAWIFVDQSGSHFLAKQPLSGSLTIEPKGFLILAQDAESFLKNYKNFSGNLVDTAMDLPNDFGFIQIKNGQGDIVSQAFWSQNLGADRNKKTLEFTKGVFREGLRDYGTPGSENSVENLALPPAPSPIPSILPPSPKPTTSTNPPVGTPKTGKIIINEIFYNPGKNSQPWIELKNQETKALDLGGWKIVQLQDKKDVFLEGTIPVAGYKVFPLLNLNKNSETLQIFDGEDKKIFEVKYSSPIPIDWSAARFENSVWKITSQPTPEKDNVYFVPEGIKENFVPQELIPEIGFENASPTADGPINPKPPDKNNLLTIGFGFSLGLSLIFVVLKKKLII